MPEITAAATTAATLVVSRPGCQGGASSSAGRGRRTGMNASRASNGSSANPPISPARYSPFEVKLSVTGPAVPGGSTQPCCQPLTVTGANTEPLAARAVQPGLMLSGTTSTRDDADAATSSSRWSALQSPVDAGTVAAVCNWLASGPANCTPSTTNAAPGLISNSCSPAGSVIGPDRHGLAATGPPSSSAPTVVVMEVWTNCPATPMTGPRPHGRSMARARLRAAS